MSRCLYIEVAASSESGTVPGVTTFRVRTALINNETESRPLKILVAT